MKIKEMYGDFRFEFTPEEFEMFCELIIHHDTCKKRKKKELQLFIKDVKKALDNITL